VSGKFNAERDFLEYLHNVGFVTADRWLASNFEKLGYESTIKLSAM
jgi:NTE family protein